ncbi:hypothetical protein ACFWU3_29630 [Streptomyces sp. NPDC058685]|uniref:hypothetical protein n=1 Tax=Streptomyces sp. NPDC058685 TaxID=3346598 RepID=UPI003646D284
MTTTPRQRFSVRAGLSAAIDDGPYDDVPNHLREPLQQWVREELYSGGYAEDGKARLICLRLRFTATARGSYVDTLSAKTGADLLDVVDALLAYRFEQRAVHPTQLTALSEILNEGGSSYRINENLDGSRFWLRILHGHRTGRAWVRP